MAHAFVVIFSLKFLSFFFYFFFCYDSLDVDIYNERSWKEGTKAGLQWLLQGKVQQQVCQLMANKLYIGNMKLDEVLKIPTAQENFERKHYLNLW